MPEKVYTPEIIEEAPFPGETSEVLGQAVKSVSGQVYSPVVSRERGFRVQRIATELMSRALNTRSKKILQEFELKDSGGLKIGNYKEGVAGEFRLTPNGAIARDIAGLTTFAIDGLTGDAIFKGTVRAGSLISDAIIQGGSLNINDRFTVDKDGNVVVTEGNITVKDEDEETIIDSKGLVGPANFSTAQAGTADDSADNTTSTSVVDIPDTTIPAFNIERDRMILIIFTGQFAFTGTGAGLNAWIYIGGDVADLQEPRIMLTEDNQGNYITLTTYVFRKITAASPPTSYTIKARWKVASGVTGYVKNKQLSYYLLGK